LKEQGQQVQMMAIIYGQATRVLNWLGKTADDSDAALEGIRIASKNESMAYLKDEVIQQAILELLWRPVVSAYLQK
jgi:hypothetical protein